MSLISCFVIGYALHPLDEDHATDINNSERFGLLKVRTTKLQFDIVYLRSYSPYIKTNISIACLRQDEDILVRMMASSKSDKFLKEIHSVVFPDNINSKWGDLLSISLIGNYNFMTHTFERVMSNVERIQNLLFSFNTNTTCDIIENTEFYKNENVCNTELEQKEVCVAKEIMKANQRKRRYYKRHNSKALQEVPTNTN